MMRRPLALARSSTQSVTKGARFCTAWITKPRPSHPAEGRAAPLKTAPPLFPFRIGDRASAPQTRIDLPAGSGERPAVQSILMDRKAHRAMTRGRLDPEARIDLHGMTVAEAHPALTGFVLRAWGEGRRLVLVITGKGKSGIDHDLFPRRGGILRHQVPHWLSLPPLQAVVLQVTGAHARHGGEGAYYVYLRRGPG